MLQPPPGTRVFLACGVTDMRKGFDGLAALVQTVLAQDSYGGALFCFRGRRGDLMKCLAAYPLSSAGFRSSMSGVNLG
jgi:transposase